VSPTDGNKVYPIDIFVPIEMIVSATSSTRNRWKSRITDIEPAMGCARRCTRRTPSAPRPARAVRSWRLQSGLVDRGRARAAQPSPPLTPGAGGAGPSYRPPIPTIGLRESSAPEAEKLCASRVQRVRIPLLDVTGRMYALDAPRRPRSHQNRRGTSLRPGKRDGVAGAFLPVARCGPATPMAMPRKMWAHACATGALAALRFEKPQTGVCWR